jgi:hypothetical protein
MIISWASPYNRELKTANIVFDGNSITAWEDGTAAGKWTDRLKLLPSYSSPVCTFTNTGQSGASTWVLAARASQFISPLYKPGQLNICCIWEGLNDLGTFPGNPVRNAENLRTYCLARREQGWKTVVFGLQNARVSQGGVTTQASFDVARPVVNTWLSSNWRSFADAFVNPSDSPKLNLALVADVPDGIHPSSSTLNEIIPLVDAALKSIAR